MSSPGAFIADLRLGLRSLSRAPALSLAAVTVLALGIGANAAVFTLVSAILLRPLPGVSEPSRLVNVHGVAADERFGAFSYPDYADYRDRGARAVELAAFNGRGMTFGAREGASLVTAQLVSGNYFGIVGATAATGRLIGPAEDRAAGAAPVAVVSHGFWKRRLGADPGVVGREIRLNGASFTVIGVAAEGFTGHFIGFPMDVWVPLATTPQAAPDESLDERDRQWLEVVGRLRPEASLSAAEADLRRVATELSARRPASVSRQDVRLTPLTGVDDSLRGGVLSFLAILQGVAGLVLLAAAANVAGLLLARATARRRDAAIRVALGASRAALVRQHLAETALLFAAGGVAGLLAARWAADLMVSFQPRFPIPLRLDLAVDLRVILAAVLAAFAAAAAVALVPAGVVTRSGLVSHLKGLGAPDRSRLRGALVAGQVAVSVTLLAGAGLFLRTLQHASSLDPGFDTEGVHLASVNVTLLGRTEAEGRAFYASLLDRASVLPGVSAASLARRVPLGLGSLGARIELPGRETPDGLGHRVEWNAVTPGYFATLGIPIVEGRSLAASDGPGAAPVAVVSRALARRFWPDRPAVGQRFRQGGAEVTVVGVAADSAVRRLGEPPQPQVYRPFDQGYAPGMTLLARTAGDVAAASGRLRREIWALDPELPVLLDMPLAEYAARSLAPQRLAGAVTGALGFLGVALAALGVHGIVTQLVAQRTREVGVRMALGADAPAVARLFLADGVRVVLPGVALGLAAAWAGGRLLRGFLAGVSPVDPLALAGAGVLVAALALAASGIPAWKASRVDPVTALRAE
jgi:predicted permease